MLKEFFPHEYVRSVFAIDYRKLYDLGYRGIIFDIDNTLVHHGEDSTPEVDQLFRHIHQTGLKTLLLSNNSETRILRFLAHIDSPYIPEANKPDPAGYQQAVNLLALPKEQVICIGDQVFTDILGANKAGLDSILVEYLRYPDETKIGIRRNVEKVLLWCYTKSRYGHGRLGNILIDEV